MYTTEKHLKDGWLEDETFVFVMSFWFQVLCQFQGWYAFSIKSYLLVILTILTGRSLVLPLLCGWQSRGLLGMQ